MVYRAPVSILATLLPRLARRLGAEGGASGAGNALGYTPRHSSMDGGLGGRDRRAQLRRFREARPACRYQAARQGFKVRGPGTDAGARAAPRPAPWMSYNSPICTSLELKDLSSHISGPRRRGTGSEVPPVQGLVTGYPTVCLRYVTKSVTLNHKNYSSYKSYTKVGKSYSEHVLQV